MIIKTNAIALRITPFSETSRIVAWLTPNHGKLLTVIKGALRRDSAFQGQFDLFCASELLFYPRWHSGLHVAGECSMLESRSYLRNNWKLTACASYMAALINQWLPPLCRMPELFSLLQTALDNLETMRTPDALLPWFEMRLLDIAGLAPGLTACLICHQPVRPRNTGTAGRRPSVDLNWSFSSEHGGLICRHCNPGRTQYQARKAALDVSVIMGFWQAAETIPAARRMRCNYRQWNAIMDLLGSFVTRHLDVSPRPREIMLELLRLPDAA